MSFQKSSNLNEINTFEDSVDEFYDANGNFDPLLDKGEKDTNISIKVPVHCRGFEVPQNINKFLEDIMPNMSFLVKRQLWKHPAKHREQYSLDIIGSFCIYFLSNSETHKIPVYKNYDPAKYSKIPFYRYLLNTLSYFVRNFNTKLYIEMSNSNKIYSLDTSPSHWDDASSDHSMNMASTSNSNLTSLSLNPQEAFEQNSIENRLRDIIVAFSDRITAEDPSNVYSCITTVYGCLVDGLSKTKIAAETSIHIDTVYKNVAKIKSILQMAFPNLEQELRAA